MKRSFKIWAIWLLGGISAVSCIEQMEEQKVQPARPIAFRNEIAPVAAGTSSENLPPLATKSLVDAATAMHIETNFLRIDEKIDMQNKGLYTFPTWDQGYLMEASVISSPANKDEEYMRSVLLNPIQSYKIRVTHPDAMNQDITDTTFYHTRMISWYPVTCKLHKQDDGTASITKFSHFRKENVGYDAYTVNPDGTILINFKDLDGSKDIMVSEVREGQHWHHDNRNTPTGQAPKPVVESDIAPDAGEAPAGTNIYRQPFGRNKENPGYKNCFRYKHYMTAIKVYAYAEKSEQNAAMWGKIRKVMVRDQPKSCSVTIPNFNPLDPETKTYGNFSFNTNDMTAFAIRREHLFGTDTNADSHELAPENPSLEGTSSTKKLYLGYALVAPDRTVTLDIHTESGIYSIEVKNKQKVPEIGPDGQPKTDAKGNVIMKEVDVFKSGFIYDVTLNFGTGGTIAAMLLLDSEGNYYDLTLGKTFKPNSSEGSQTEGVFKYQIANTYIVDPTEPYKTDPLTYYDGYTFLANVKGNGQEGILPSFTNKETAIKPVTAGLIWESALGLITQVEYMYNYIRFKVQPPDATGKFTRGNAVIGAYDANGKVLWSWHIWVTDRPKDVQYKVNNVPVNIMDRNLGAEYAKVPSGLTPLCTYGLYYQWGRKDPSMLPPDAVYRPLSTATSTYYDYYGNELRSTGIITKATPTIEDGVENPMYLILPTEIPQYYQFNWLFKREDELWGETDSAIKTIYDPCPFGYRIPGETIRTLLKSEHYDIDTYNNAFILGNGTAKELIFPLAGYKGVDRGMSSLSSAWKYVGEKGDYMSKNLFTNGHRQRLYLSKSIPWKETGAADGNDGFGSKEHQYTANVTTDWTNRRTAASVRCIRSDFNAIIGQIFPYIDISSPTVLLGEQYSVGFRVETKSSEIASAVLSETKPDKTTTILNPDAVPSGNQYESSVTRGTVKNDFNAMGHFNYSLEATNNKGLRVSTENTVTVINISDLYDIKLDGKSLDAGFDLNSSVYLSLKINMREKGQTAPEVNKTTAEDLALLFNNAQTWINGEHTGAQYDPSTQVFTTKNKITLLPVNILQVRANNGQKVLKEYKMEVASTTYTEPDPNGAISDPSNLIDQNYYMISQHNTLDKNIRNRRFWGANPIINTTNDDGKVSSSWNGVAGPNKIFQYIKQGNQNKGYLKRTDFNYYIDSNLKMSETPFSFGFEAQEARDAQKPGIVITKGNNDYIINKQKGILDWQKTQIGGLFFTYIKWQGDNWYFYEITPKVTYKLTEVK